VPPPDDASAAPPLTPANKLMAPPAAAGDEGFEFFLFFFASSAQNEVKRTVGGRAWSCFTRGPAKRATSKIQNSFTEFLKFILSACLAVHKPLQSLLNHVDWGLG
jgi:hypothetical protein